MDRRRFFRNSLAIGLAGLAGSIPAAIELLEPGPFDNLSQMERNKVRSVFSKGNLDFYFMPEQLHGFQDLSGLIDSIMKKEGIDCLMVEGLEGDADKYAKKVNFARAFMSEVYKKLDSGEVHLLDYQKFSDDILYCPKNSKIIVPQIDFPGWIGLSPGGLISLRLRLAGFRKPIFGIDSMKLYNEALGITIARNIEAQLDALDSVVNHPIPGGEPVFKFTPEIIAGYGRIKPQLEEKLKILKAKCRYSGDFFKEDEIIVDERDKAAAEIALNTMRSFGYKKALIIRGVAHYPTLKREFEQRGFKETW